MMTAENSFITSLPDFSKGQTTISLDAQVLCARKMRDLKYQGQTNSSLYTLLEKTVTLKPNGQVPASEVVRVLERETDAIFGSGSVDLIIAFSNLLPQGAQKAVPERLLIQDALDTFTPMMCQAAQGWNRTVLHTLLFPLTSSNPVWEHYWLDVFYQTEEFYVPAQDWLTMINTVQDSKTFINLIKKVLKLHLNCGYKSTIPVTSENAGNWLQMAGFLVLLQGDQAQNIFKPLKLTSATLPFPPGKAHEAALITRALARLTEGTSSWSLDPELYLNTPAQQRLKELMALGRAKKTA
jgi:hypothetical protein